MRSLSSGDIRTRGFLLLRPDALPSVNLAALGSEGMSLRSVNVLSGLHQQGDCT